MERPSSRYKWIYLAVLLVIIFLFLNSRHHASTQPAIAQLISTSDTVAVSDVRFLSENIGGMMWYRVVVPKADPQERLPVLYLLHGANSGPVEFMQRSPIVELAVREHLIVVMPEGGYSYFTNAKHRRNARWEDAITHDLAHDVETRFMILRGREHTGISGISMGGYGAIKLALKHPEQYGFAASMSGALDITRRNASIKRWGQTWRIWTIFGIQSKARRDEDVFDLLQDGSQISRTKWFESCGQDDPLLNVNERFAQRIRQSGADINTLTTPNGHDWQSWNAAMPKMFSSAGKALH